MRRVPKRITREMLERIVGDSVMVNAALLGAFVLRVLGLVWLGEERSPGFFPDLMRESLTTYVQLTTILTPLALSIFFLGGFYTYGRAYSGRYKALVVFQAVTLTYLAFGAVAYLGLGGLHWLPRTVWATGWALTLALVGGLRLWSKLWRATVWAEAKILRPPPIEDIRNVVVVGGAGYVGSVLVRRLLDRGYHATVLDALVYGDHGIRDLLGHPDFQLVHGDLRHVESIVGALQYGHALVHLGALVGDPACDLDKDLTSEINLAATRLIADIARGFGVRRFVFASTCSVYGASQETLDERSALKPISLYARTKVDSERALLGLIDQTFSPVILRFATVYGLSPRPRFDLVVNALAAQAVREGKIEIYGGDQWRPFIHVADAADAVIACLRAPLETVRGQVFNAGSNEQNHPIREIGKMVRRVIPGTEVLMVEGTGDPRNYRVSFAKVRRQLGFVPKRSLEEGIAEIRDAILDGTIPDSVDGRHSNVLTLSDESNTNLIRTTRVTPLYRRGAP